MPAGKKFWLAFLLGAGLFLIFPFKTLAAMSLTFSGAPASVEEEEFFEVDVSLVGAPANRTYFLRAALHEADKTQYFGYTYNHEGNWHNAPSEHTKFLQITTSPESSWSGRLKAKADTGHSAFKGAGEYQFKIGRYTEGGSLSWSDNSTTIIINMPSTPTPIPETPTSIPTPTPQSQTFSPMPTLKLPTPTPTKKPTPTLTPTGEILGEEEATTSAFYPLEATPEAEEAQEATPSKRRILPLIFLGLGLTFLAGAAYWVWYTKLRWPKQESS